MIFEFGKYKVDIDVEKTKQFYEKAETVDEGCSCDGCQNFSQAVDCVLPAVKNIFANLGIDMRKVRECYVNCTNQDGTLLYGGFCHLCGNLISGESAWIKCRKAYSHWDEAETFAISDDFHVSFQNEVAMLETDFPLPVIQLEFSVNMPWVLEKESSYR